MFEVLGILGLAFLGGLSINLMPCIFPMLPMKIYNITQSANDDRKKLFLKSLWGLLGTVSSFLLLGISLFLIRLVGGFKMWGYYMQNPYMLSTVAIVLIPFLLDAFDIKPLNWSFLQRFGSRKSKDTGHTSFFIDGFLTTLIASPCAGPVLAGAISLTFTLPAYLVPISFIAMGLGLGLPVMLLCLMPNLLKRLPKSGKWMLYIKKISGIGILGMIIWILSLIF